MAKDQPVLGVLLMLGFCVMAPMGDAVAKLLTGAVPIALAVLTRFAVQAAVLVPMTAAARRPWRMSPRVLALALLRTVLHILGIAMMFTALYYLPLADAIAIAFVMPFIMLLLGRTVLGEEVGPRRLAACAVGFVGTLMVIQPSFREVGWNALWPLGVAVNFALFMLCTRRIAKGTDPIGLQAVSGIMAVGLMAPLLAAGTLLDLPSLQLAWPTSTQTGLLLAIGLLGTGAHLLMTWSLRYAPSATLAPMQYLEIPIATLLGWAIFGDLPDGLAAAGIAVIMAAGLYIVLREHSVARAARRAPATV